jgi:hypothetical protein
VPVDLPNSVALTTPGFGGRVYFPIGKGFIVLQVMQKESAVGLSAIHGSGRAGLDALSFLISSSVKRSNKFGHYDN